MSGRMNGEVPRRVARAASRFEAWRRTHAPHTRIPQSLWTAAVELVAEFGVSYTATRLMLNYYDLKKHVEATPPPSGTGRIETVARIQQIAVTISASSIRLGENARFVG